MLQRTKDFCRSTLGFTVIAICCYMILLSRVRASLIKPQLLEHGSYTYNLDQLSYNVLAAQLKDVGLAKGKINDHYASLLEDRNELFQQGETDLVLIAPGKQFSLDTVIGIILKKSNDRIEDISNYIDRKNRRIEEFQNSLDYISQQDRHAGNWAPTSHDATKWEYETYIGYQWQHIFEIKRYLDEIRYQNPPKSEFEKYLTSVRAWVLQSKKLTSRAHWDEFLERGKYSLPPDLPRSEMRNHIFCELEGARFWAPRVISRYEDNRYREDICAHHGPNYVIDTSHKLTDDLKRFLSRMKAAMFKDGRAAFSVEREPASRFDYERYILRLVNFMAKYDMIEQSCLSNFLQDARVKNVISEHLTLQTQSNLSGWLASYENLDAFIQADEGKIPYSNLLKELRIIDGPTWRESFAIVFVQHCKYLRSKLSAERNKAELQDQFIEIVEGISNYSNFFSEALNKKDMVTKGLVKSMICYLSDPPSPTYKSDGIAYLFSMDPSQQYFFVYHMFSFLAQHESSRITKTYANQMKKFFFEEKMKLLFEALELKRFSNLRSPESIYDFKIESKFAFLEPRPADSWDHKLEVAKQRALKSHLTSKLDRSAAKKKRKAFTKWLESPMVSSAFETVELDRWLREINRENRKAASGGLKTRIPWA